MPAKPKFTSKPDNQSMPAATVIPVLHYPDVPVATQWLCRAFGFVERLRIGGHRVQLAIGEGAVVVAQSQPPDAGPESLGHSVMVRVNDVDEHFELARKEGARILSELATYPYGERQYTAADLAGHVWTFSQSVANVAPSSWGGTLAPDNAA